MKRAVSPPPTRRQKVVDSMAKKFADHGSVEQIIVRHRRRGLRLRRMVFITSGIAVVSMVITGLFTVGVMESPALLKPATSAKVTVTNTLDLLNADMAAEVIGADQFALYCKDYLNRYDSLPEKYKTSFSTTTSTEVYRAIVLVWETLTLRTRQKMLKDLPYIETVQKEFTVPSSQGAGYDSSR